MKQRARRSLVLLALLGLAANGEWELRQADGSVLQYGLWRVEGKTLVWSVRQGERVIDDPTPVLAVERDMFSVRERDGATTVFRRLR
ncbi:MAG: hypothetical protein HXL68_09890 [Dechloromonas agitata]|uniref:Uncharacterized protein n=1 Tax=Dechloromonas agitata TaxID=73030 RepID=A0A930BV44_9RHOO|nr:hypothetical protein [Dechloromonas agitata]